MGHFAKLPLIANIVPSCRFGGLLTTEFLEPPPGRCFLFRQTYRHTVEGPIPENLRKLINSPDRPKGPPPHFHQFQTEYFRVENGVLGISVDGVVRRITPEDGEISVKAGSVHNFFIHPDSPESMTVYLSASDSGNDYQLDRVFFENWYGYWHDALLHDGGIDWIQFLAVILHPRCTKFFFPSADMVVDSRWRGRLYTRSRVGALPPASRILDLCYCRSVDWRTPGV